MSLRKGILLKYVFALFIYLSPVELRTKSTYVAMLLLLSYSITKVWALGLPFGKTAVEKQCSDYLWYSQAGSKKAR